MTGLEHAILGLEQVLDIPRRHQAWRVIVRQRMAGIRDALIHEYARSSDAWLAARERHLQRERTRLIARIAVLGNRIIEAPDVEPVREELHRLVNDLEHHSQRVSDLAYDAVSLELGGSE